MAPASRCWWRGLFAGAPNIAFSAFRRLKAVGKPATSRCRRDEFCFSTTLGVPVCDMVAVMAQTGPSDEVFKTLQEIRTDWPKRGWSWDSRFSCVASSFGNDLADEAYAAVSRLLTREWTAKSIVNAPPVLRQLADDTGGIRADQLILTTDPGGRLVAYGLWWPWGDDLTISLRVGLAGYASDAEMVRLRELFGAAD